MIFHYDSKDKPKYLQSNIVVESRLNPSKGPKESSKQIEASKKLGYSYEVPTNFISQRSLINENTYNNPHINGPEHDNCMAKSKNM